MPWVDTPGEWAVVDSSAGGAVLSWESAVVQEGHGNATMSGRIVSPRDERSIDMEVDREREREREREARD